MNKLPTAGTADAIWLNELLNNIYNNIQRYIKLSGEPPQYIVLPANNLQRVKVAMQHLNGQTITIENGTFGPVFFIFDMEVLESHKRDMTDFEVVGRKNNNSGKVSLL